MEIFDAYKFYSMVSEAPELSVNPPRGMWIQNQEVSMSIHPSLRSRQFTRRRTSSTKAAAQPNQAKASARKRRNRSTRAPSDPAYVAAKLQALERQARQMWEPIPKWSGPLPFYFY